MIFLISDLFYFACKMLQQFPDLILYVPLNVILAFHFSAW